MAALSFSCRPVSGNKNEGYHPATRSYICRVRRHRLHCEGISGQLDLAFPGWRKVVFIHGCLWPPATTLQLILARGARKLARAVECWLGCSYFWPERPDSCTLFWPVGALISGPARFKCWPLQLGIPGEWKPQFARGSI